MNGRVALKYPMEKSIRRIAAVSNTEGVMDDTNEIYKKASE